MQKVDLGHGRGWASARAAASIFRIDRQLGRLADINEAGRSPERADENHRRWLAYQNGGPWAPYALPADESVHCQGDAADSDDWYNAHAAAVWRDHGWRQTARYPKNPKKDEPWHGEYFPLLDNHRNDPVPTSAGATLQTESKEDDMRIFRTTPDGSFYLAKPGGIVGIRNVSELQLLRRLLASKNGAEDTFNAAERDIIRWYLAA